MFVRARVRNRNLGAEFSNLGTQCDLTHVSGRGFMPAARFWRHVAPCFLFRTQNLNSVVFPWRARKSAG